MLQSTSLGWPPPLLLRTSCQPRAKTSHLTGLALMSMVILCILMVVMNSRYSTHSWVRVVPQVSTPFISVKAHNDILPYRRLMTQKAGLFEKWFGSPKYADDAEEEEDGILVVEGDTEEMAGLRQAVLRGTFIAKQPLELAYDAQRDGWTASKFHQRVDERGPAVLIGRTREGVLFGAYNGVGWASVEDYRDTFSAFLFHFPSGKVTGTVEILPKVGPPAIFDFGAQGPTFGADALRIPLGKAPLMGSSYAAAAGGFEALGGEGTKDATSRLGSYYAGRKDGKPSLFGDKTKAELKELRIYVAK